MTIPGRVFPSILIFSFLSCIALGVSAQTGVIQGRLFDEINNQPLEYGVITLQGASRGTLTDSLGRFALRGIPSGLYNVEAKYKGYQTAVIYEVQVTSSKPYTLEIGLKPEETLADSIQIVASPFKQSEEAPLSLRTIGANEIQRNPGGNRDISRVIQSLPGVASTVSFRNDILIRGGGPNENRFYIDGIETPNINHFATQGASGGPVGLINVDFIGEVDFYSGAFPANRGNALSSVFEFQQRAARTDRIGVTATVGASDLALTLEGPTSENSSFLFSVRRSYLQLLFKLLALPFLPNYNDYQYRHKFRIGERHEINIVSLGALDEFALNLEADSTPYQKYILGNLPVQTQWNYTIGASYKYFGDKSFWTVVASRNMLENNAFKYPDNDESLPRVTDYSSREIENKFRVEHTGRVKGFKWNYGANYEFARYFNDTYFVRPFGTIDFESQLDFHKYGAFAQLSKRLFDERLSISGGLRIDGNSFSETMRNPLEQLSPRFSASFALTPALTANFNTGIFYQLPPYTVLGYRDTDSRELVNRNVTYIRNRQVVGGLAYVTQRNSKFAIEAYYKNYDRYPFLIRDSISLANLGGDFGVVGNEPASSISEGRTYGLELLAQQRLFKGFYGILAYTLGWSEFQDKRGNYVPSSWDSRHIIALTMGKKFGKDWEVGAKWRFTSGNPYTPSNVALSSLRGVWDVQRIATPDFERLNSERLEPYHQLDVRVDKKWFFDRWSLNLYFDMQNVYGYQIPGPPILDVVKGELDQPLVDPADPSRYQVQFLENNLGIIQPTLGIVITY
ncbi:MAG: TonB-dependent receptor [Bacteroidia bacterium]|nr:TonB-dependent receptor [Bacteroidia bacterium]